MTVNKAKSNGNADKKQAKDRILRAKDIIPGVPKSNSEKIEQITNIPKFDLAEEILAEQRKITAIKRKAPTQQREIGSISYATGWSRPALSEQEQIIVEIVAKDIKKLRDGDVVFY
jgi:hypothetical protein